MKQEKRGNLVKKKDIRDAAFLGATILAITLAHYYTATWRWDIHDFLRRLYYIPLIMTAFRFRLKGGILCSIIISAAYAPHFLFPHIDCCDAPGVGILNQLLEMVMFIGIGSITGFLVESDYRKKAELSRQIDQLTRLEEQVRRAEKLSAVGELASGVAHEIRNPLGIIKTIAQTILSEIHDEEASEGVEIIIHEVDRANAVIKSLLDFAKPGISHKKSVSLGRVINDVLMIATKYAGKHNVRIESAIEGDVSINADIEKLKQAFVNIIFNSIEAMPLGGTIEILADEKDGMAQIHITDSGKGIPDDIRDRIFDPFYTTKDKGTGLGLSIVHSIIEEHGGRIVLEKSDSSGTVFLISLPVDAVEGAEYEE